MAAKFGYDAIKYVLKKVLTKKGVKGIATIPGKAYDMRMKQLTDEMANKMKALGYDINNVTEKQVQGLLDSAEALAKQKKPTVEGLLKGEKYTDERGRVWDFGTKDRPYPGFTPRVQQDVNSIIKDLKDMEPVAAMKEANLIIGRKGRYKNLSNDEAQRILKDTDDHIFQRDIQYDEFGDPIKPEPDYASGGRVPLMYGGDPGFAFEYGGSWADWHDQHRDQMPVEQYIKTKLPKHRLPFREMQSGGLAYMLGEPTYMKYYAGGSVGHAPWHKPTGQAQPTPHMDTPTPHVAGTPDPLKAPRGIPSLAPKNMDPAYMQKQMMQTAMMGQGPRPMANEGGRIGFDKGKKVDLSKRRFLKGAGAAVGLLSMLPFVGKFFKAAKLAKPAAAVTETIVKSNAAGMPAWFPSLVKRVLKEGKDETEKLAAIERQTVHTAKTPEGTPIQVTRDLTTDDIIVDIGEQTKHGWGAGRHGQPTRLVLKKGEWVEPDVTQTGKVKSKGGQEADEFWVEEAEFTGGHPENVKFEEVSIEKYGDHGSDFSEVERFATGKKNIDKKIVGKQADKDAWAEGRAESQADEYDKMRDEGYFDEAEKDFYEGKASGGLAGLLGE